jgi:hypothetical protein
MKPKEYLTEQQLELCHRILRSKLWKDGQIVFCAS